MQVRVAELRDTLKLLQPVVPRKSSLPVIANVLLRDGKVIGTDLETMVMVDIPEIEGECLLPHKATLELLNYVPGGAWATIEQGNGKVRLSWEDGNAEYDVPNPKEYPAVRDIEPESEGTITDGDSMVATLRQMLTYRTNDESRPVLSGVTVAFGETMEICAGDGFRMAYQILPLAYPGETRVTIPAGSVNLLCTLWDKAPPPMPIADSLVKQIISKRQLNLSLSKERLAARFGKVTLLSNLIQGTAPNFAQLIPQEPPFKVNVWAPELDRCVNRVRGVAQQGNGAVRLSWNGDKMIVSAKHEANSISAEMNVLSFDGGGRTAVNVKYLRDYLAKKEGVVTIGISSEQSPLLFRYGKTPLVVIMPMFVDWEDKKPEVTEEPEPEIEEPENLEAPEDHEATDQAVKKPEKKSRKTRK